MSPADLEHEIHRFDASAPISRANTPPSSWYTDPAMLKFESQAIFQRSWQFVGHSAQWSQTGDYVACDLVGEPAVVLRGDDGELRGFFNVCRHHASCLLEGAGRTPEVVCPYHGWTYALDGRLLRAPGLGLVEDFDRSQFGLAPIEVASWGPLVFARCAPGGPTLNEVMAPLDDRIDCSGLRFVLRQSWEVACNWKVYVDNFLDGGYHIDVAHLGLDAELRLDTYRTDLFDWVSVQSCAGIPDARQRVGPDRAEYAFVFPNFMINRYGPIMDTNWVIPLSHDRTRTVFDYFFDAEHAGNERFVNESLRSSERIQREDIGLCESVQRGVMSAGYDTGRYAARETGMLHFHQLLAGGLRAALPALLLALCLGLVACGSDPAENGGEGPGTEDAAGDAGVTGDSGGDLEEIVDTGPPPMAPLNEAVPFPIYDWRVSLMAGGDPIGRQLELGTFTLPETGVDGNGIQWESWELREDGSIGDDPGASIYAVAEFYTGDPVGIIVRADLGGSVYLGDAQQPGDVYASGRYRFPLRTTAGTNLIVVQAYGRGDRLPSVSFETTEDELYYNFSDVIVPDLRLGDDSIQYVGVPILNLSGIAAEGLTARVAESEYFEESELWYPSLGPGATTQVAWELRPKAAWDEAELTVPVTLQLISSSLAWSYERNLDLLTVTDDAHYRRSFRSNADNSAQFYGVAPPTDFDAERDYALILSLHGAGVGGLGQARAYGRKDWNYLVAATNRRPFGFDWEAWGRVDGIEVLDDAMAAFNIDPTQVYLTGHSMGGHGTWQLGVHFPGRFATIGPSAGWSSFYSYGGSARPGGAFARSQASSDTNNYLGNLARRGVYIIHGDADDNVPVREGRDMYALVQEVTDDVIYHEQPGAGHWWNVSPEGGVDCVDWPPLHDFMQDHRLDPFELDFDFTTPAPWVNPTHSYVTIRSARSADDDCTIVSESDGSSVSLTTRNVRSMILNGAALIEQGVDALIVDGDEVDLTPGDLPIGPQDGKTNWAHGPFNQVMHQPFCFAYPDDGPDVFRYYAAYLLTNWQFIGNGHGCSLPVSSVDDDLRADYNIIYIGVSPEEVPLGQATDLDWNQSAINLGGTDYAASAALAVFPDGDRLAGVMTATLGAEYLLFRLQPFTSRFVAPDYLIWNDEGAVAAGFFDANWNY
jgi:choline monooxygenase